MAKDIKLYKDGNEVVINETQLDNFLDLGWKKEQNNISTTHYYRVLETRRSRNRVCTRLYKQKFNSNR